MTKSLKNGKLKRKTYISAAGCALRVCVTPATASRSDGLGRVSAAQHNLFNVLPLCHFHDRIMRHSANFVFLGVRMSSRCWWSRCTKYNKNVCRDHLYAVEANETKGLASECTLCSRLCFSFSAWRHERYIFMWDITTGKCHQIYPKCSRTYDAVAHVDHPSRLEYECYTDEQRREPGPIGKKGKFRFYLCCCWSTDIKCSLSFLSLGQKKP